MFNRDQAILEASYAACRRLCRRAASNLATGFRLLPHEKRRGMEALYAFARHSDDLVDHPEGGQSAAAALAEWRAALRCVLQPGKSPTGGETRAWPLDELMPALADTVARFHIPAEHLEAVLDGVEMDLHQRRYETFDDLQEYCRRVASAVGLACIHIWGFRGLEAFEPAGEAGMALQLTNILRDLKEDTAADRIYLPLADLRSCGYSVEDLKQEVVNDAFHRLMALEIGRAEASYRKATDLFRWIEPDGRRLLGIMLSTYHRLLAKIKRRPADVFTRRIGVGRLEKLAIAARWVLFSHSVQ